MIEHNANNNKLLIQVLTKTIVLLFIPLAVSCNNTTISPAFISQTKILSPSITHIIDTPTATKKYLPTQQKDIELLINGEGPFWVAEVINNTGNPIMFINNQIAFRFWGWSIYKENEIVTLDYIIGRAMDSNYPSGYSFPCFLYPNEKGFYSGVIYNEFREPDWNNISNIPNEFSYQGYYSPIPEIIKSNIFHLETDNVNWSIKDTGIEFSFSLKEYLLPKNIVNVIGFLGIYDENDKLIRILENNLTFPRQLNKKIGGIITGWWDPKIDYYSVSSTKQLSRWVPVPLNYEPFIDKAKSVRILIEAQPIECWEN